QGNRDASAGRAVFRSGTGGRSGYNRGCNRRSNRCRSWHVGRAADCSLHQERIFSARGIVKAASRSDSRAHRRAQDVSPAVTRVGALVETDAGTRILIDTPPELRLQLISAGVSSVDAILFTHDHADHVQGIDDVRALSDRTDAPIDMYGPPDSLARLAKRFAYIFDDSIRPLPGTSKPEGRARAVPPGKSFRVGDVEIMPVSVPHGPISVYGYRIGKLGYITDAKELPEDALRAFRGVDVLGCNARFRVAAKVRWRGLRGSAR